MSDSKRKLAAIVFTDIVDFTKLTSKDQQKASDLLDTQRDLLKPLVESYSGKWVKEMGDGLILTFDTINNAVECCLNIQNKVKKIDNLVLRIGIHLGEILEKENDIIGDDVNVTARIEPFSAPGGIAISNKIHDAIIREDGFNTKYLGKPKFKGVAQEVKIYCITSHGLPETVLSDVSAKLEPEGFQWTFYSFFGASFLMVCIIFLINILFFKVGINEYSKLPSLAIIPFENKGESSDNYYSYGLSTDLVSDISNTGLLRVSSMRDISILDYANIDNTQLSKNLSVQYLIQGTLWKMGDYFQLAIELFDSKEATVIWSESWKTDWAELLGIQNDIIEKVFYSLGIKKEKLIKEKIIYDPVAYEYYLRAKYNYDMIEKREDVYMIREILRKAIAIDGKLIKAKNLLANTYNYTSDYKKAFDLYNKNLNEAERLNDQLSIAESMLGIASYYGRNSKRDKQFNYVNKAYEIQKKNNDISGFLKSQHSLAKIHINKIQYDKAYQLLQSGLNLAVNEEDLRNQYRYHKMLGSYHRLSENFDKDSSLFHLNKALFLANELGIERLKISVLKDFSTLYSEQTLELENPNKNIEYLRSALNIATKNNYYYQQPDLLYDISHHMRVKNDSSWIKYYYDAIHIANEYGMHNQLKSIYSHLIWLMKYEEEPSIDKIKFLNDLNNSLNVAKVNQNIEFEAQMNEMFGYYYQHKSELNTSMIYYEKSYKLYELVGNKKSIYDLLTKMLEILGEKKRIKDFEKYYEMNKQIVFDIDNPKYLTDLLSTKEYLQIQLGNFEEVINIGMEKLNIAKENKFMYTTEAWGQSMKDESQFLGEIGWYYLVKGEVDSAVSFLDEAVSGRGLQIDSTWWKDELLFSLFFQKQYHKCIEFSNRILSLLDKKKWDDDVILGQKLFPIVVAIASKKQLNIEIEEWEKALMEKVIKKLESTKSNYNSFSYYLIYKANNDLTYLNISHDKLQEDASSMDIQFSTKYLKYPVQSGIISDYIRYNEN